MVYKSYMPDDNIDPEQFGDALKAYKAQLDALKGDIEVIVACSVGDLVAQARAKAQPSVQSEWAGNPKPGDAEFRAKCERFVERYKDVPRGRSA
jgi:hypothetical protein